MRDAYCKVNLARFLPPRRSAASLENIAWPEAYVAVNHISPDSPPAPSVRLSTLHLHASLHVRSCEANVRSRHAPTPLMKRKLLALFTASAACWALLGSFASAQAPTVF